MTKKKFKRRTWKRYSKLGRKRKKKQVWRKPKGRDNKMREKRKGYPAVVSIGYRGPADERGKIKGKEVVRVENAKDLDKVGKNQIAELGRVGMKKRIKVAKKAKKNKIKIHNLNIKKTLKKVNKKSKKNESKK